MGKHKEKTYKILKRGGVEVLLEYPAPSLRGANLRGADLKMADLLGADLFGADLHSADLHSACLQQANLIGADLSWGHLEGTNLIGADFAKANLSGTNLTRAKLSKARLRGASLVGADLTGADLNRADLSRADLSGANLYKTDFRWATLSFAILHITYLRQANLESVKLDATNFSGCETLGDARGLLQVRHEGPSSLDHQTLRACVNHLPDEFLYGVGYTQHEIDYLRSLYTKPFYLSCFLSHGNPDSEFADKIYKDRRVKDVSCWHYNYDLKMGKRIDPQIREEIQLRDKLLVVCSKESLTRFAVVKEILEAIKLEDQTNETKLFPIRLDGHILTQEFRDFHDEMVEKGEWSRPWLGRVLSYWIGDFSDWQNPASYNKKLDELIHQLRQPTRSV